MGYYTNFDLTDNSDEINTKIEEISGYTVYDGEINEAKWYNHREDLIKVSLLFPDTTILCEGVGEENGDMWIKKDIQRDRFVVGENKWFRKVDNQDSCDIIVRRVGGRAGQVLEDTKSYSKTSTYFLKSLQPTTKQLIIDNYPQIKEVASNTVGVRSIGLDELQIILDKQEVL